MPIKIAFIGAGSLTFTRGLFRDILTVPELKDTHFAFSDINKQYLDMAALLCGKDIEANKLPAKLTATTDRRRALDGADYVINCTRIGGLDAFKTDIDIPLKYGVDQCVGDTLCAGGIMYGQRNIPAVLDFCRDIKEVSAKDALFLNYANPNCINTWAANQYGKVNTVGLCHGVMGGHHQITEVIKLLVNDGKKPGEKGYVNITPHDVDIICAGINHQTWYIQVRYAGEEWTPRLLEGFQRHPLMSKTEKVRIDMLKRFGYYSTESNGHLSEYVPWYRKRPRDIGKWIDMSSWINGETGGYLRVCTEGRNWFKTDFKEILKTAGEPITPQGRGHEHGSYIIEALETGRAYRGHFIVTNRGCITNLPPDAAVEVPGYVDRNGISIPFVGDLPQGCAAVCNASITVQRMAVDAGVNGDVNLLKQAMMMDPLVGAVCDPEEISQLTDEMLVAQAKWLPQYKGAIAGAKSRLAAVKREGKYLGTQVTLGAARRPILSAKQNAEQAIEWARIHAADVLEEFHATDLHPTVPDLRRVEPPRNGAYSAPMKARLAGGRDGFLDVRSVHGGKDGLIFLRTKYEAAKAAIGRLIYGADGPVKVWVNGETSDYRPEATNPAIPGQYEATVKWKKGKNDIVFVLDSNEGHAWGLYAAATLKPDGNGEKR
ncbi:MAG: alpha-glucosidase/alpha-galactosidase [Planctomycetes bacterium]|nr:alpha-glucosidase/alpha-galactosidase [Planctomycetota bacterium]